jgi:3-oxoacyl-[acyl-carrier protein] reductase
VSVVLVTGGSRGIGRAVVERLAGEGATVAFTWCSEESRARQVEAACGGRATPFRFDLRDRRRPGELVDEVEGALGPLEGLVNNAGVRGDGLLVLASDEEWDAAIDADLGGAFRCCRAALPGMVHRRRGAIVNVSSLIAIRGVGGQSMYAAAKAGLVGLTRSLAREVGPRGVRVNAVLPGFVATDMTADLPDVAVTVLRSSECLRGGTAPDAVAGAVAFLLSDAARSITGQVLAVDAGASA